MSGKKRVFPLGFLGVLAAIVVAAVANDPAGALRVARQG